MPLRVLIVAPEHPTLPRLAQSSELTRIGDVRGVSVDTIGGLDLTIGAIGRRLRNSQYDMLIWSGHGASGQLLMPDNSSVEPLWLASECKSASIRTVILAVCDSAYRRGRTGFTDTLPENGIAVVAMQVEISDTTAIDYEAAFVRAMARGETARVAHRIGIEALGDRPDANGPQFYPGDAQAGDTPDDIGETLRNLVEVQRAHDQRLARIEHRLFPPWQVRLWQGLALFVVVGAIITFSVGETRLIFFGDGRVGALLTFMALGLAGSLWRMSDITRERIK